MTMAGDIVRRSFHISNLIGELDYPTPAQGRTALGELNNLLLSAFGGNAGEALNDWPLGTFGRDDPNYPSPPFNPLLGDRPDLNSRLIALNVGPATVYLSAYPQDGSRMGLIDPFGRLAANPVTLDANGRTIDGAATSVIAAAATPLEWFYRADLGQWMRIANLAGGDTMPFPQEYDPMFTILLAMRVNPRFGGQMDDMTLGVLKSLKTDFIARYLQAMPLQSDDSLSWPFMSRQGSDRYSSFSSTQGFNTGRVWG